MNSKQLLRRGVPQLIREFTAIVCAAVLIQGNATLAAQKLPDAPSATQEQAAKIPAEQLDSLVAPIALYPDPMLSQVLMASTYPLEIVQLQQWLNQNKGLKEKALADAVQKQNWDPTVQAMAAMPDLVKQLADNIKWTTDLGNAFLAQQGDVMAAVQRMRKIAQDKGNLKSSEQQKVETKTVESKQVIVIEQSNPQVVYVPSYNPTVVYGAMAYPYPPIYYPPVGYYAAGMAISFGVGIAMGAAWGGGWCCGAGWGGNNNVYVNHNNNFVNNGNRNNANGGNRNNVNGGNRGDRGSQGGRSNFQHNPQHRGGAPYGDRKTASQFGGTTRGDSKQNRQASARQDVGRQQKAGSFGNQTPSAGTRDAANRGGANAGNRGGASAGNTSANRGGGGDRVGNQRVPSNSGSSNRGAFGGSGSSGSGARASQSRGSSSMGGSRGGGGGGSRGGGGGRRR